MTSATLVYLLCFIAALTCALLLMRAYRQSRTRLLLWNSLGFMALTLNNLLLVVDLVVLRGVDLWAVRQVAAIVAIGIFVYGFLWEAE